jgi:hypothetical protein
MYFNGGSMDSRIKIERLLTKLNKLGPMLPGSISEQWSVCGTPGCACKASENPIKHGPYFQLSFSVKGRSSTMFIKADDVAEARRRVKRYKEFKELSFELVQAHVDFAREHGLQRSLLDEKQ